MSTLIGWWKGEDNGIDSVNGNDAVWEWTPPRFVNGYINRAFDLWYESAAQIKLPDVPVLDFGPTSKFTVEDYVWMNSSWQWASVSIWVVDSKYNHLWHCLIQPPTKGSSYLYASDYVLHTFTIPNYLVNQWNKVKITHDNSTWNIYTNDVLIKAISSAPIAEAESKNIYIGYNSTYGGGYVDEIKIYDDSESPTTTTAAPISVNFSGTPLSGSVPLSVQFTDLTTGFIPYSWLWNFGDGTTSTSQNPIHIYTSVGLKTVSLTVTDSSTTGFI
jgi:PKD repeat protein